MLKSKVKTEEKSVKRARGREKEASIPPKLYIVVRTEESNRK